MHESDHNPILNPRGRIEPMHLGQHFIDPVNEVLYQSRGTTADDWHLVPPPDLWGSFVKIYDRFLGLPQDDPQGAEARQEIADAETIKRTMELAGVHVLQAQAWKAGDVDAMAVRLRVERPTALSIFVGFAPAPTPSAMPKGIGFSMIGSDLYFGRSGGPWPVSEFIRLRVEIDAEMMARAFLDDVLCDSAVVPCASPAGFRPVVALFDRTPGRRPIAPGYEMALKRKLECRSNSSSPSHAGATGTAGPSSARS